MTSCNLFIFGHMGISGGYDSDPVDISILSAQEVSKLAETRGYLWDPNWYDPNAKNEVWTIDNGINHERHNTGTYINKYSSEKSYNHRQGDQYFRGAERTFKMWLSANDKELEDWQNGVSLIVKTGFTIISFGYALEAKGAYEIGGFLVDLVFDLEGASGIGNEMTLGEEWVMETGGEQYLDYFKKGKKIKTVFDISKSTVSFSNTLEDGEIFKFSYDFLNKTWNTIQIVYIN